MSHTEDGLRAKLTSSSPKTSPCWIHTRMIAFLHLYLTWGMMEPSEANALYSFFNPSWSTENPASDVIHWKPSTYLSASKQAPALAAVLFMCTGYLSCMYVYMHACRYSSCRDVNSLTQVSIYFGNSPWVRLRIAIPIHNATLSRVKIRTSSNFHGLSFQFPSFRLIFIWLQRPEGKGENMMVWTHWAHVSAQGPSLPSPLKFDREKNQLIITGQGLGKALSTLSEGELQLNSLSQT